MIKQFEKSGIKHERIISSINNLGTTRDTLNAYITKVEKRCVIKERGEIIINLKIFSAENDEIKLKILSNCIKSISKSYYPPRAKKIIKLLNTIKPSKKLKATLGGCVIEKIHNKLVVYKEVFKKGLKI